MSRIIPVQLVLCVLLMLHAEVFGVLMLQSHPKRVKFLGMTGYPPGKRDATPGDALYRYDSRFGNDDTEDAKEHTRYRSQEAYEWPSESAFNQAAGSLQDDESELRRWINPGAKFGRNVPVAGWDKRRWLNTGAKYRELDDKLYRRWLNPGARIPVPDENRDVGRRWLNAGARYRSANDFNNDVGNTWDDDATLLSRRRRDVLDISKNGADALIKNDKDDDKPSRAVRHVSTQQQLQDSNRDRRINAAFMMGNKLNYISKPESGKQHQPFKNKKTPGKRLKFLKRNYVNDDHPNDEKRLKFLGKRKDEYPMTVPDLAFTEAEAEKRLKFLKRQSDDTDIESQKRLKFLKRFSDDDIIESDKRLKFLKKNDSDGLPDKRLKFLKRNLPKGAIASEKRLKFLG